MGLRPEPARPAARILLVLAVSVASAASLAPVAAAAAAGHHQRHPAAHLLHELLQEDGRTMTTTTAASSATTTTTSAATTNLMNSSLSQAGGNGSAVHHSDPGATGSCTSGLLTFELSTGFIYKPAQAETLAMMPSTLQLTDCLDACRRNSSCQAVNFEMGLCVLLSSSAKQNPAGLFSSQFPVFTIYAEKKCLLQGEPGAARQRLRQQCRRAWTFERAAGFEMRSRPRRRLRLQSREQCMEACLGASDFECRSANWRRQTGECTLHDQDRHSVAQAEAGDQQLDAHRLQALYGPAAAAVEPAGSQQATPPLQWRSARQAQGSQVGGAELTGGLASLASQSASSPHELAQVVDYLENNCVVEPNRLCEFRKIQNRVLKTVDSIYQDVGSLEQCKQRCLSAPYRCYSFDYGDTAERVCRTSHLDQASLLHLRDPYLEVAGAVTYELASCFSVSVHCGAREMLVQVAASKSFRGRIYAKSRPQSCMNDVREALHFELAMGYRDPGCDVRAQASHQQGVFSQDLVIQHHDRIVTTQDVGLTVYCHYDLGNRSVTNSAELSIERLDEAPMESKNQPTSNQANQQQTALSITSLATTVVRSPNVTMRITNMLGQPVQSATVGDRLALLFEIKEKTSPFGIFVREIIAMDGRQLLAQAARNQTNNNNNNNNNGPKRGYHYSPASSNSSANPQTGLDELAMEALFQAQGPSNSVQFIDAHGCPTDANLMGPLVKMDPAGRRVLAPFDAFKFPASDVVFFRAVVTSCVSECQPAVCAPPPGLAPPPPPAEFYSSTTLLAAATSSTPSPSSRATPPALAIANETRAASDAVTTTASLPMSTAAASLEELPQGGALSAAQRQQVVKLLETRLEQQLAGQRLPGGTPPFNGTLSGMAHLYANFLASLVLGEQMASAASAASSVAGTPPASTRRPDAADPVTARSSSALLQSRLAALTTTTTNGSSSALDLGELVRSVALEAGSRWPAEDQIIPDTPTTTGRPVVPRRPTPSTEAGGGPPQKRRQASLQALADSYLGAFQSYGRRKRKRRSADQLAALLDDLETRHAHPGHAHLFHRPKREAEPTHYDLDELVVQSIKIVDRLQFGSGSGSSSSKPPAGAEARSAPAAAAGHAPLPDEEEGPAQVRVVSWTSPGLLGAILLAGSLVFLQLSLALACLVDWSRRRRRQRGLLAARLLLGPHPPSPQPGHAQPGQSTNNPMISREGRALGRRDQQLAFGGLPHGYRPPPPPPPPPPSHLT